MKALLGIGILHLLVTGLLLFKIVSLETSLEEAKSKLSTITQQRASAPVDAVALMPSENALDSALTIEEIRNAVRDELEGMFSNNPTLPVAKLEQRESDPALISEFESRIDYYLSDGAFSRLDLHDMENKLIKLAPADRRKMMNKLTKAMSKANIQLIE